MPRVPTVGLNASPSPALQAPGVISPRAAPNPSIGKALQGLGGLATKIGLEVEDKVNDGVTLKAANHLENWANKKLIDLSQMNGEEGWKASDLALKAYKEEVDGIRSGRLFNQAQIEQFNRFEDKISSKFDFKVHAHKVGAAAEFRQQGLLARSLILTDSIVAGKLTLQAPDLQQGEPHSGYDMKSAQKAGLGPDADGHWPSRDPETGLILKSQDHPTFHKTVRGEEAAGMAWWHDPKTDRWHTFPAGITDKPESMGLERATPDIQEKDTVISPELLSNFSKFLMTQKQIGEGQGLSGDALNVFVMGEAGKLLQSVVTTKLKSDDPSEVATVTQLIENLPDGVIGKTKHQQLLDLAKDRSLTVESTIWAANVVGGDGKTTFADALQDAFELSKTDPKRAEKRIELLIKLQRAKDYADASADGALLDEYREIVAQGGELTPEQKIIAQSKGFWKQVDAVRTGADVTDDYGSRAFHLYNHNPVQMLKDFNSDVGLMFKSLGPHMSEADLRILTGQFNHYAKNGSGPANSSRIPFNTLSTNVATVINTRLHELDELHTLRRAKDGVKSLVERLKSGYGVGVHEDKEGKRIALTMLQNRFSMDVVTRANTILETMPKGEKVDRNEILQKAAEAVWNDGWLDSENTINRYTTELKDRPKVDDALIALRPAAEKQLREDREAAITEAVLAETRRFDPGWHEPRWIASGVDPEEQLTESLLGLSPDTARRLTRAKKVASIDLALDAFSPAEIDARAGAMRKEALRAKKQEVADSFRSVRADIAKSLVSPDIQVDQLTLESFYWAKTKEGKTERYEWLTEDFLKENPEYSALAAKLHRRRGVHRRVWEREMWGIEATRLRLIRYRNLPKMEDLKKKYTESGGQEWENFALLFYPGPLEDLPKHVRSQISQITSLAGRSDIPSGAPGYVPRGSVPRYKALLEYWTQTDSKGEFIN